MLITFDVVVSTKIVQQSTTPERVILGIDPGTTIMGYGVIVTKGKKMSLVDLNVLNLTKIENHPLKLKKIFETLLELIEKYQPDELAIEAPFFGKNVQSMLKLGRAQGVAMAAALYRDIPIFEYLPKKIKQSVTGNGNASKEQVAAMMEHLLEFKFSGKLDATDGLAAAVCHFLQGDGTGSKTKAKDWSSFLEANPNRIK
ncbi:MAG: crossover junction endodeoxyribonuclease RuvC [Bacteroidota bacterium]